MVGFLAALIGLWLEQQGIDWTALLATIGWILFGAAALGARAHPRMASTLLKQVRGFLKQAKQLAVRVCCRFWPFSEAGGS